MSTAWGLLAGAYSAAALYITVRLLADLRRVRRATAAAMADVDAVHHALDRLDADHAANLALRSRIEHALAEDVRLTTRQRGLA